MKSIRWLSTIMLLSLIISIPMAFGDPGSEPYTPTKLEWLVMELNAQYRQGGLSDYNWGVSYRAIPPATVEVLLSRQEALYPTNMLDSAVSQVKELAQSKGWDWVIVTTAEAETLGSMSNDELVKYILELRNENERLSKPIDQNISHAAHREHARELRDNTMKLNHAEREYAQRFPPTTTPGKSNADNQAQDALSGMLPGKLPSSAQKTPETPD